ncbi:NRDE family protein [Endozoicomonas ascidiicola]|nr:NRDE family protein [Endozoicomonas ascidiicola]
MCLIVFSWQPDTATPLILAANRDEFYQRPTDSVQYWDDHPDVFGGRDLEAGGSWLAINENSRFAAVTNYREMPSVTTARSRGELVNNFVTGSQSAHDYLHGIKQQANQWSGFNLLVMDNTGIYYFSNRAGDIDIAPLPAGIYGLTNHLLDTPWPKLIKAKDDFSHAISQTASIDSNQLVELMHDSTQPSIEQLPDTGVGKELEKLLSSCFIASPNYGTRNTSVLVLNDEGILQWTEQNYLPKGVVGERQNFRINTVKTNELS